MARGGPIARRRQVGDPVAGGVVTEIVATLGSALGGLVNLTCPTFPPTLGEASRRRPTKLRARSPRAGAAEHLGHTDAHQRT